MKLNDQTLTVLKNFSEINQSLEFKSGNILRTVSPQKNILATAEVPDSFPSDFSVYELNRFLGVHSLMNDPELTFNNTHLTFSDGQRNSDYVYCETTMFVTPPDKDIAFPEPEIKFDLTETDLESVMKASSVLGTPEIAVTGDGSMMRMVTLDTANTSSDTFSVELGNTSTTFRMVFKTENFKMMKGNYDVAISSKGISHFKLKGGNLQYWIATEATSNYGG